MWKDQLINNVCIFRHKHSISLQFSLLGFTLISFQSELSWIQVFKQLYVVVVFHFPRLYLPPWDRMGWPVESLWDLLLKSQSEVGHPPQTLHQHKRNQTTKQTQAWSKDSYLVPIDRFLVKFLFLLLPFSPLKVDRLLKFLSAGNGRSVSTPRSSALMSAAATGEKR